MVVVVWVAREAMGEVLPAAAALALALGTDNAAMSNRIYKASAAIELRRPSLIATDGLEQRAMEAARRGLLMLREERTGDGSAPAGTSTIRAGQPSEGTC